MQKYHSGVLHYTSDMKIRRNKIILIFLKTVNIAKRYKVVVTSRQRLEKFMNIIYYFVGDLFRTEIE